MSSIEQNSWTARDLNDKELEMVEEMGYTGFTPYEIAEVLEIPPNVIWSEFTTKKDDSAIYKRYRKGFLRGQLELRQRIMKDAKHGSSPAQTLMKKIFDDADHYLKQL